MESIRFLYRKRIFSILVIIQLIIALYGLTDAIATYRYLTSKVRFAEKNFDTGNTMIMESNLFTFADGKVKEDLLKVYEYVKESKYVDKCAIYSNSNIVVQKSNKKNYKNNEIIDFFQKIDNKPKDVYGLEQHIQIDPNTNEKLASINTVSIDPGILSMFKIKIDKGRAFTEEDFIENNKFKPVLIGSDLEGILDVGDEFMGLLQNTTYKVVGVMNKNVRLPENSGGFTENIKEQNFSIIELISANDLETSRLLDITIGKNLIYIINDKNDLKLFNKEFENKLAELNLATKPILLKEDVDLFKKTKSTFIRNNLIRAGILLIFVIGGMVSSITLNLMMRKREIGIKVASGATKLDIIINVFKEELILISIAMIINFLRLFREVYLYTYNWYKLDFITVLYAILVVIIITLIAIIIPAFKILKLQPKDLIGGME